MKFVIYASDLPLFSLCMSSLNAITVLLFYVCNFTSPELVGADGPLAVAG